MTDFDLLIFIMSFPKKEESMKRTSLINERKMVKNCYFWENKKDNIVQSISFFKRINERLLFPFQNHSKSF